MRLTVAFITQQGWGAPKTLDGKYIEGSFNSHQVPLPAAKKSEEQLSLLNDWLSSYEPRELFTEDGQPVEEVLSIIPFRDDKKMGMRKEANANFRALDVPKWFEMGVQKGEQKSCTKVVGEFLHEVIKRSVHLAMVANGVNFH